MIEICFFLSLFLVFHSYMGYAILAFVVTKLRLKKTPFHPLVTNQRSVTLIIAAYNEELTIESKILNSLALDYPADKLTIFIVSDGSTDKTTDIVKKYPQIIHYHDDIRDGKVAAVNRVMQFVNSEITVFSDANTFLNIDSIKNIALHYEDAAVGGVAGEKRVLDNDMKDIAGAGEGLYWKYESLLKKIDSAFYSVVGAAGELFSVRTSLYEHPGNNIILDDFVISLKICQKGYRVIYEPKAFATEKPSVSLKDEKKRKVRISAGAFQAMLVMKGILNISKYPKLAYLYISHRVMRWTLCPILLPIIFVLNTYLVLKEKEVFYLCLLLMQTLFYLFALLGWYFSKVKIKFKLAYFAYYFVFMNISLYQGFLRYIKGNQSVLWEKAIRN